MNTLDYTIWIASLVIVALVIVPVAINYLRRALKASRAIEHYLADMLTAGVAIAGHTAAVPALDETIGAAVAMRPVAEGIEAKTGLVATLLAGRAAQGIKP